MKKKKPIAQKPKEFAARPFATLKGVHVREEPAVAAAAPRPPAPKADVVDDDSIIFLRSMTDVTPLHSRKGAPERKPPAAASIVKRLEEEERRAFLESVEKMHLDVRFEESLPDDVEPLRPLPVNRLRQLKRGAIRIDLELDLHGLTRDEALTSLAGFIAGAWNRDQRAVLVITGKGLNSPDEPVLRSAVAGWLRDKGKGMVAEFAPAPRNLGGDGAYVVFLKGRDQGVAAGDRKEG